VQDAGERGLGGVTVQLLDAQGRVVAEAVTAEDGSYLFEDVAPGRYTVRIDMATAPAGYVVTTGDESIAVEVGPGESVLTADFPLAAPVVAPAPIPGVDLPRTGGELPLALLGATLVLLLAGAVLLLVRRRRA
jgi:LPXTG-motif cell wall-anchored protein